MVTWKMAVLNALHRYTTRHHTNVITRQALIDAELDAIIRETGAAGVTPAQTLSRVLQELRDEGVLYFFGNGNYLFLGQPVQAELDDLPADALDVAIKKDRLRLGDIPAGDDLSLRRTRRGQARLRALTLQNYAGQCAFCDVRNTRLLVASHIARWADLPAARGNLRNILCLCRFHDALFEYGYFSLLDDYRVVKKEPDSDMVAHILSLTTAFRAPLAFAPSPEFLQAHRARTGFA